MGILLIESSSRKIEFGYAVDSEIVLNEELDVSHNADTLTYFIKKSFQKKNIKFDDIEIISLSNGPGSFTGLRIGSAISKGICFALGSKLIEVSTLDIIANKLKTEVKIVSLVFSNPRTLEFYFCEYTFELGKLKKLSDYKIGLLENILSDNSIHVINESLNENFPEEFKHKLKDVSQYSNVPSQFELTTDMTLKNEFSNYTTSKPFYLKEFIPKIGPQ